MRALNRSPAPRTPAPRGPGPSRLRYRLARLWALPRMRALVQVYLPLTAVAVAGWLVVSTDRLRLALQAEAAALIEYIAAAPEFAVRAVEITGAPPDLKAAIERRIGDLAGHNSLTLDVDALHTEIAAIGAVDAATVFLSPAGVLEISVERRVPVALWRDARGVLRLIDADGVAILDVSSRIVYPDLPLIVGEGAEQAVDEALAIFAAVPALAPRVRALVRIGARRWDVALPRFRVLLPEIRPAEALQGAMALHYADALFDRDLTAVDLRVPARPVLRATPDPDGSRALQRTLGTAPGRAL